MLDDHEAKLLIRDIVEDKPFMPTWAYLFVFFIPAVLAFLALHLYLGLDLLFSGIVSLAVMNGSINSVIAILTIRLDGSSSEALEHLETLMLGLDDANEMVTSFTTDLEEAKDLFKTVGVDLTELDLEPVADVVEKLKENKSGLNEILDNLKDVDVSAYIKQAKGIDWQGLLDAADEVMGFIKSKQALSDGLQTVKVPTLPSLEVTMVEDDDEGDFFVEDVVFAEPQQPAPAPKLSLPRHRGPKKMEPYQPPAHLRLKRRR